uniref:PH domain-containing protein n=1 Tax=Trieres chinensis TaxID=1514140 RepID=A0A7S2A8X6_TRICV|mmetsp:Transcript_608/g.1254  ORF Transcript_608/g.1254 Transcript_608/m.1254 type:complete len:238 (+) Transcript_608:115-828(+)
MSQEIRHRNVGQGSGSGETQNLVMGRPSGSLSAKALLDSSPTQQGSVMKLHVPSIYVIAPTCLQRILSSGWLPEFMSPYWTDRHMVLIGKFLYRFENEFSSEPKGAPVPVEAVEARCLSGEEDLDGMEFAFRNLPPGCNSVFIVSTFGKTQYFGVATKEECTTWVNSLRESRQAAITRSMGHSEHVPYPARWKYFDGLGTSLLKSKERIKKRLAETNVREMEMTSLEGTYISRGHFS